MKTIDVLLDGTLFSADVVARAAHRYTGTHFVEVMTHDQGHLVRFTAKVATHDATHDATLLAHKFKNDVLDERLRAVVRDQTGDLQVTLLSAALREATPHTSLTQS